MCHWGSPVRVCVCVLFPDDRVKDYPLMQSPVQMTSILVAYVLFSVYVGPRMMANRKPFGLNRAMIIYNLCMVLLNAYIVYEVREMLMCWVTLESARVVFVTTADDVFFSSWCLAGPPPSLGGVTWSTQAPAPRLSGYVSLAMLVSLLQSVRLFFPSVCIWAQTRDLDCGCSCWFSLVYWQNTSKCVFVLFSSLHWG